MKKTFTFLIILLFLAGGIKTMAQTAAEYQFAGSTGTYTEITGSTTGITTGDDYLSSAIDIGFSFTYCGIAYTQVKISTNCWVGLGTAMTNHAKSNNLASTTYKPLIAPLWDDNYSGDIQYTTDGTSPNRIFTVQWKNIKCSKASSSASQNFQVKLYETTNKIEIIFGNTTAFYMAAISIGMNDATGGSGHFLSVTPNATPSLSTVSSTTSNNNISSNAGLSNGTLYTFTPPSNTANPATFTATAANATEIDLSWAKNPANDNVMVAWNTSNTFGAPANGTSYSAGNTITGGGTVLYNGDQTTFNHTPVLSNTTYYYKAWSVDNTNNYSTGKTANATTPCGKNTIYPFTQNFEGSIPPTADCWSEVRTPSSSYGWGSSAGGYSGNCAAFETANNPSGNQSKLITPVLDLSGLSSACLKFYFKNAYGGDFSVLLSTDGGNTYPNILWSGLTGQSTWTEKLKDISAYTGAGYDNVRIAFQGTSNYNVDYIYLDNVVVEEIPVNAIFLMSPTSKNFGEIIANSTSTPQIFTISNNGQTPLVINNGGITLTGTDAGQFTLSDANTYPINLAYGQTVTVSVSFSPTSTGNKTAQLQIVANAKETHTADLSGTAFAEGSLRESFEGSFPPEGWSIDPSTWGQSSSQYYEGVKCTYYTPYAVVSDKKLITPQLTIITGSTLKYYAKTNSGTTQTLQVKYSPDLITWTDIGIANTLTTTWTEYIVDLSSIAGNNYYLAIAATTTYSSAKFYVDYVRGPVIYVAPPQPATIGAPANAASKVNINTTLTWSSGATGGTPQGYKLYFGTDGGGTVAPTNIENGTVQTSPYTPATPLTFGTTYYWQVIPFNSGGDATGCPIWSFSTMTGQAGLWNGAVNNDWANVSNWDNAQLPVASTDVIIPAGLTSYPTLSAAGTCHNLTMEPGTSLLGNANLTITGTANVQLTIDGVLAGDNDKWHLISQPVASIAQASDVFNHCYLKQYNETTNLYEDVVGTTPLNTVGKGYSTMYSYQNGAPTTKTLEFIGSLNNGTYSMPLSFTTGQGEGWNLVGSPYPSAIDWDAVSGWTKPAEMNNSIYFWDNSLNGGIGNFTYYLGAEGSNQGVGVSGGSRYIPPMQGFFVKTSAVTTLVMDNGIRVHNNTPFYKDGNTNPLIRLQVVNGSYSDETVVRFDANATSGADNAYDCWKLFASDVPQLSTVTTDNVNMAINTFPQAESDLIVPLQLNAGVTGNFTIRATEILNFNDSQVMLEDKILNITQDLTQNPAYSFTASIGDNPDRFNLHFKSVNGINDPSENKLNIYSCGKTVYINPGTVNLHGQVVIYDILGKPVVTKQLEGTSLYCLHLNITPGCYIVKVITGNNVYSQKVVIK